MLYLAPDGLNSASYVLPVVMFVTFLLCMFILSSLD